MIMVLVHRWREETVCVSLELRVYLLWNLFYFSQSIFDAKKVD